MMPRVEKKLSPSFMINNSAFDLNHQNDVDTMKIKDKTNKPANMNLMVILLSPVVVAFSTYFSIKALKPLKIAQQSFGLRN
jgi:hypothetical protein